jgi:hypothetical protein
MPQPLVKKSSKLPWIIGGSAVGLVALIGVTVGVTIAATSDSGSPRAAATTRQPSAWDLEQQATNEDPTLDEGELGLEATSEPTPGPTLNASKIKLTPKVTDKQCFGSAGCNVSIKVEMAYNGPDLSEDETFEVTYEVKGGEDGPIIGTFEVTGKTYSEQEESLSTRSKNTKLSIKVTDVEKVGI